MSVELDVAKVDALFAEVNQCHLPGVAVGIAIDGRTVYRKGFGLASLELPVILSPSIRMRIGSTTKHFTAFTTLRLCEQGRAGIDDPIGKFIPELPLVARAVTLRQLMGNTSGLRDVIDITIQSSGQQGVRISTAELLSLYQNLDHVGSAPGTTWLYNNGGWAVLLTTAIERISGKPLEEAMRQLVFEPIGMHDTLLRRWETDFVANSASSHARTPAGTYERLEITGGIDIAGAGAIASTVDDMLRWLANMDTHEVGTESTWALMRTPQTLRNGTSSGYGLGLINSLYRGAEVIHHSGGGLASNAQMLKVPAAGLDVTVLSNRSDVSSLMLAYRVLDTCLPALQPVRAPYKGPFASAVFRSPRTGRVVQLFPRGEQYIVSVDGHDLPFEPDDAGVLRPITVGVHIKRAVTLRGAPSKPTSIQLSDFGNLDELLPVPPVQDPSVAKIAGHYRLVGADIDVTITATDAGPRLRFESRYGSMTSTLECLAEGVWKSWTQTAAQPPGGILAFEDDARGFHFSNGLNLSIPFRRVT